MATLVQWLCQTQILVVGIQESNPHQKILSSVTPNRKELFQTSSRCSVCLD